MIGTPKLVPTPDFRLSPSGRKPVKGQGSKGVAWRRESGAQETGFRLAGRTIARSQMGGGARRGRSQGRQRKRRGSSGRRRGYILFSLCFPLSVSAYLCFLILLPDSYFYLCLCLCLCLRFYLSQGLPHSPARRQHRRRTMGSPSEEHLRHLSGVHK